MKKLLQSVFGIDQAQLKELALLRLAVGQHEESVQRVANVANDRLRQIVALEARLATVTDESQQHKAGYLDALDKLKELGAPYAATTDRPTVVQLKRSKPKFTFGGEADQSRVDGFLDMTYNHLEGVDISTALQCVTTLLAKLIVIYEQRISDKSARFGFYAFADELRGKVTEEAKVG